MTTIKQVMEAIVMFYDGVDDITDYCNANDVLDDYRKENPADVVADMIDIYLQAAEEYNQKYIDYISQYAKKWLEDF
jgi:hypothetical protein